MPFAAQTLKDILERIVNFTSLFKDGNWLRHATNYLADASKFANVGKVALY